MAQYIRLRNWSVHVPSIVAARIRPSVYLRRPEILVEGFHFSREYRYRRSEWERAQKEFDELQKSIEACQDALKEIPRIESYSKQSKPLE